MNHNEQTCLWWWGSLCIYLYIDFVSHKEKVIPAKCLSLRNYPRYYVTRKFSLYVQTVTIFMFIKVSLKGIISDYIKLFFSNVNTIAPIFAKLGRVTQISSAHSLNTVEKRDHEVNLFSSFSCLKQWHSAWRLRFVFSVRGIGYLPSLSFSLCALVTILFLGASVIRSINDAVCKTKQRYERKWNLNLERVVAVVKWLITCCVEAEQD